MATPPTFSSGAILTAAQMNQIGLWQTKTQVVGSGVSSVTVLNAFTTDFDSYKIIYDGGAATNTADMNLQLADASGTASTTGYYGFLFYGAYTAATVNGYNVNNGGSFYFGGCDANYCQGAIEIHQPNLAKHTLVGSQPNASATNMCVFTGRHAVATAYPSFKLSVTAGTLTGGTIRVYGYRN